MKVRILIGAAAVLCIGILLASAYWVHKTGNRVDEFGHQTSIHPSSAKVNPGVRATLEDPRERAALPEYQDVPAPPTAELTSGSPPQEKNTVWTRSQGDEASSRYSGLTQINKDNVQNLRVAWTCHSNDGNANIQSTPVIVNGVLTRQPPVTTWWRWTRKTDMSCGVLNRAAIRRNAVLTYWPGNQTLAPRLFFTSGPFLFALDPKTGQPAAGFGANGRVPSGGMVSPVVFQDVIVAANFSVINGYDIASGRRLREFDVLPPPAKKIDDDVNRGANVWGGMAMDVARGIVYVVTGSPHPNFIGVDHPGQNKGANSVIALEAKTGRQLWAFQEIRHDIWDLDTPAPPNLVTITHDGKRVDAVAEVTKLGNTLLLDRVTGKPLFPYRLRRAPVSKLPGERTWSYQPVFDLPQPFARQEFQESDITDISPQAHAFVKEQVKRANYGWFQPFEPGKATVYYNVHGGAQWTGAAFDPEKGWLYLNVNEIPWMMTVLRTRVGADSAPAHTPSAGEVVYRQNCAGCHGRTAKARVWRPHWWGWRIECWTMRPSPS
jgi:glucose dehydrogenase